jgi:hypothetical protein
LATIATNVATSSIKTKPSADHTKIIFSSFFLLSFCIYYITKQAKCQGVFEKYFFIFLKNFSKRG